MKRTICLMLGVSVLALPALAQAKPKPKAPAADELLYKRVEAAIEKGKQALLAAQLPDGSWEGYGKGEDGVYGYPSGPTAIAVYALLEAGVSAQDKKIEKALQWMSAQQKKEYKTKKGEQAPKNVIWPRTYEVGLRCNAWYLANRQTQSKYRDELKNDAELLEKSTAGGSYGYVSSGAPAGGDNSCTQLAQLGMWMATREHYEVEDDYWQKCLKHWLASQRPDGGFPYGNDNSSGTMTAAGLASLFICYDKLFFRDFRNCNVNADFLPIDKSMKWLDQRFKAILDGEPGVPRGHGDLYYFLYGVERVGLASGYKSFGQTDWFTMGAQKILAGQNKDTGVFSGAYGPVVDTSFAMLFLVRGNNAVVFNKLKFESVGGAGKNDTNDWNCRPRDLAFLTGWINNTILDTMTINWQIVDVKSPVNEWHDAPILYIAGSKEPVFTKEQIEKLRQFVLQGGTIFSVGECGGKAFGDKMRKVYAEMFPQYPMSKLPATHPLYVMGAQMKLRGDPAMEWATNGIRPLLIHCDADLAKSWQINAIGTEAKNFQIAANLFLHVTDSRPKKRGHFIWPAAPEKPVGDLVEIARVKWGGKTANWNPEPQALDRFARLMSIESACNVQVLEPVEAAKAATSKAKVLVVSGVGKLELSEEEKQALKKYAEDGGTILFDAAGGDDVFGNSAQEMLGRIFGVTRVAPVPGGARIFNVANVPNGSIQKLRIRTATQTRLQLQTDLLDPRARMKCATVQSSGAQRIGAYFSREDISCAGLAGYEGLGVDGYAPSGNWDSAPYILMRNLVLAATGAGAPATTSVPATTTAPVAK